jgi:hypothetical protein
MSLPVLVAIVAVGIAIIVLAIHLTGGSKVALLGRPEQAQARFLEDFPNEQVTTIHLTTDRKSAFLELAAGHTGFVHAVGARFLTRNLATADIASVRRAGDAGLLLRTADFTFGGGRFEFTDAATADHVAALLRPTHARSNEAA